MQVSSISVAMQGLILTLHVLVSYVQMLKRTQGPPSITLQGGKIVLVDDI